MQHTEPKLMRHVKHGILIMLFILLAMATLWTLFWAVMFVLNVFFGRLGGEIYIVPEP